jgi:hypothetical protein
LPLLDRLSFEDWVKIKYGRIYATTKEKIWKGCMSKFDPSECEVDNEPIVAKEEEHKIKWGEEKDRCKKELIEDKLDNEWFKGTESDDDDIDGIIYYLELQGHDGFTDPDDEAYEQRRCKLLGLTHTKPPLIIAEAYEVTRYNLGPDERFSKIGKIRKSEYSRTSMNVAWMRHNLIKEMDEVGQVRRQH